MRGGGISQFFSADLVSKLKRHLTLASIVGVVTASVMAFFTNTTIQERVCTAPISQPMISDVCGSLHVGNRPTHDERVAWSRIPPGSCRALRAHVEKFPDGVYRGLAADMIAARRTRVEQSWTPSQQPIALYVGRDAPPSTNEDEARAAAIVRGNLQATRRCQDFAASGLHRLISATSEAQEWLCDRSAAGVVCGFDGRGICQLDERHDIEQESCGVGRQ
jgi:hypothetical protein